MIATSYKATWKGEASPTVTVQVRPRLLLERRGSDAFVPHLNEGVALTGRLVRLQRLDHGRWHNVAARRVNRGGVAVFRLEITSPFADPASLFDSIPGGERLRRELEHDFRLLTARTTLHKGRSSYFDLKK